MKLTSYVYVHAMLESLESQGMVAYTLYGHVFSNVVMPINGASCFLEQETLPSWLSSGRLQEKILEWFT